MNFKLILILLFLFVTKGNSQTISQFQSAISDPDQKVQGIHHYPPNIKDGQCHNTKVVSFQVHGSSVTIIEHWTDYKKSEATTTLKGEITGDEINGTWESSYSGGTWKYNLKTNSGRWNKTSAPLNWGTFVNYQPLTFEIVNSKFLRDGFYDCK